MWACLSGFWSVFNFISRWLCLITNLNLLVINGMLSSSEHVVFIRLNISSDMNDIDSLHLYVQSFWAFKLVLLPYSNCCGFSFTVCLSNLSIFCSALLIFVNTLQILKIKAFLVSQLTINWESNFSWFVYSGLFQPTRSATQMSAYETA